ncbi:leucine-rich repeat neuronal protein 1-like [Liolophura sinensis]|uniref:leucine-rich repeat neuronal protein 1-like n=1 Tax=Liolophura sinensis TaxID=3198878 RepID=UPI0031590EC5
MSITLDGNQLTSLPKALLHLNDVTTLTVDGLSDEDSDVMQHVNRTLRGFTLYGTTLDESTSLAAMQYLSHLEDLSIMKVRLEEIPDRAFSSIAKTLHYLHLSQNVILGNFTLLCDLKSLKRIYVSHVEFAPDIPPVPICPTPVYSSERLDVTQSQLESFPAALLTFPNLHDLSLNQNNITDIDSSMVPANNEVEELRMSGNSLIAVPDALKKMKLLRYLDMSHNQIIALKDGDFQNLLELNTVFLDYNPITFIARAAFQNCPRVQKLSLASTMLVNVPEAMTYLPKLNLLDFSGAPVKCDCRIVWILKQRPGIRGNCPNSSDKISDFFHRSIVSCGENPAIG